MTLQLWVLNPNTTQAMTAAVLAQVRGWVPAGTDVQGVTAAQGAAVIDSRATFAQAAASLPLLAAGVPADGAVLLACFGDPGLEQLRRLRRPRPVVGLAEAAVAETAGRRFAIVTAGAAWVEMLRERVADFGAAATLTGVHALPFNGLQLAREPAACSQALNATVREAERGGAEVLVLGGAAFAGLAGMVQTTLPVIEPVAAATRALLRAVSNATAAPASRAPPLRR